MEIILLIVAAFALFVFWHTFSFSSLIPTPQIPKPRDPAEVPTPDETKLAQEHLKAAIAFIDELATTNSNDQQLYTLSHASMAIAKARSLDPHVSVRRKLDDQECTSNIDEVSGQILYIESMLYDKQAIASGTSAAYNIGVNNLAAKQNQKDQKKELKLALNAIDKALRYSDYSKYHLHRAYLLRRLGYEKEYKVALDRAYQLDPNNLEILKARSHL